METEEPKGQVEQQDTDETEEDGGGPAGELVQVGCKSEGCNCTQAYMVKLNNQLTRYRCKDCNNRWSVKSPTSFNI